MITFILIFTLAFNNIYHVNGAATQGQTAGLCRRFFAIRAGSSGVLQFRAGSVFVYYIVKLELRCGLVSLAERSGVHYFVEQGASMCIINVDRWAGSVAVCYNVEQGASMCITMTSRKLRYVFLCRVGSVAVCNNFELELRCGLQCRAGSVAVYYNVELELRCGLVSLTGDFAVY
jgi:hypothetical protein